MKFTNKPVVAYVPHGIDPKIYFPVDDPSTPEYATMTDLRKQIFGEKNDQIKFVLFYNSRNIRRKQVPDIILGYKLFLDSIGPEKAKECALLLHTQPIDENGTNLYDVIEYLAPNSNIFFTGRMVDFATLNLFYNIADVTICNGSNEGWGLSATESVMAGTPIIANVTGGLQDQMRFEDENGNWIEFSAEFPSNHTKVFKNHGRWAIPVYPSNRSIQGSVPTPYIFDDRTSFEDIAVAIEQWYKTLPDFREAAGQLGREWMMGEESRMSASKLADGMISCIDYIFEKWQPRKRFEIINSKDYKFKPKHSGVLVDYSRYTKTSTSK